MNLLGKKKQRQCRYSVSDLEVELVLRAYHKYSGLGWEETLKSIKKKWSKWKEIQQDGTKLWNIICNIAQTNLLWSKQIQIIVAQSVLKVDDCTAESSHSVRINKTRYPIKCAPDERKLTKFNQSENFSESNLSEYSDENYDRYLEFDHSVTQSSAFRLLENQSVVIPPTIATEVISMQNRGTEVISMQV